MLGPLKLVVESKLPANEILARLDDSIEKRTAIEGDPAARTRRTVTGSTRDGHLILAIHDENVLTRRKSWNVEFSGDVVPQPDGARVAGIIHVPDAGSLAIVLRLLGVISLLAFAIAAGLAVQAWIAAGRLDLSVPVMTLVLLFVAVFSLQRLKTEGERAADADAKLLSQFLKRIAT